MQVRLGVSDIPLQVVSTVFKIEKTRVCQSDEDWNCTLGGSKKAVGRPALCCVQGPERPPQNQPGEGKPFLVTNAGLSPLQASIFTVLESSATNQTLIQRTRLTRASAQHGLCCITFDAGWQVFYSTRHCPCGAG